MYFTKRLNKSDTTSGEELPYAIGMITAGLSGGVGLVTNFDDFVMVWVAPKIWLIKEIAHLAKSITG